MRRYLLFVVILAGTLHSWAQNVNKLNSTGINPPSPEVASFGKFVDIPMGYNSGTPIINIPIYTVQQGMLSFPIALNYNAAGIKVEEVATWVGLGWNLSTGGSLSRVVHGLPDDIGSTNGYMYTTNTVRHIESLAEFSIPRGTAVQSINENYLDADADEFIFSAMGYSTTFLWNQDSAKFIQSPFQNIKIEYTTSSEHIDKFIITLPNGIKCFFGKTENGSRASYELLDQQITTSISSGVSSISSPHNQSTHFTGWSLMELVSPREERITFHYTWEYQTDFGRDGEATNFKGLSGCSYADNDMKASFYSQRMQKPVLQYILSNTARVNFVRSPNARLDLFENGNRLDSITVLNKSDKLVKKVAFRYEYRTSPDSVTLPGLVAYASCARRRLFLTSLADVGDSASRPYVFTYSGRSLPSRLSASQDYYGYYNGKLNGIFLTPLIRAKYIFSIGEPFVNSGYGADRRIDTGYTQAGILKSIQYPTGGTTEYIYERNLAPKTYYDPSSGIERSDLTEKSFNFPLMWAQAPDTLYYKQFFTVGATEGKVNIIASLGNGCPYGEVHASCRITVKIKGITDPGFLETIQMSINYFLTLPAGEYQMEAFIDPFPPGQPVPMFSVSLNWREETDPYNYWVGGVRVKQIISRDGLGKKLERRLEYKNFELPYFSSGFPAGIPVHIFRNICGSTDLGDHSELPPGMVTRVVSNSALPLSASGQAIRYLNVTEFMDTAGTSFKNDYLFSNDGVLPALFPYEPQQDVRRNWLNGQLLQKRVYEKTGNDGYRIVAEEKTSYASINAIEFLSGIKLHPSTVGSGPGSQFVGFSGFVEFFNRATEWYLPDSTHNSLYAYIGSRIDTFTTTTKNFYNASRFLSRTQSINSKGELVITRMYYPGDFNDVSGFNISTLYSKYIVGVPIRQDVSVNGKIQAGAVTKFDAAGKPVEMYEYENADVVDTANHNRNSILESNYSLKQQVGYTNANVSQITEPGNFHSSMLWDQYESTPIAVIRNAAVSDVAYTSFEDGSSGNWSGINPASIVNTSLAATGFRYLSQSGFSLYRSANPALVYYVTYWSRNGTFSVGGTQAGWPKTLNTATRHGVTWTCYEHKVTGQSTISVSGSGMIDEVRLAPEKSLMSTYCYQQLVGLVSVSDPNNNVSHFEYDHLNRLSIVRDKDNNILKRYCYNLAGEQTICGTFNYKSIQKSATFTRSNCGTGVPSTVTYTLLAGAYTSTESQEAADQLAQNDVDLNGQSFANTTAGCVWSNAAKTYSYARSTCTSPSVGGVIQYNLAANLFTSTISQEDADQQGKTFADLNGQAAANSTAPCVWKSVQVSGTFSKSNCGTGGVGSSVIYNVPAETYQSTSSQAAANALANNDLATNGPLFANAKGTCTYYSIAMSNSYTKQCTSPLVGTSHVYSLAAGAYTSSIDLATANAIASAAMASLGQANANSIGSCVQVCNPECDYPLKKCINGTCSRGIKVVTSSSYDSGSGMYTCYFHYEYNDGSWSATLSQISSSPCE